MNAASFAYHRPDTVAEAAITALLRDNPNPTDEEIREGLSGNFCRCTGYQGIVNAVHRAAEMT